MTPNAKGLDDGWPNVEGLAGCEPIPVDGWPNPPVAPPLEAPNENGDVLAGGVFAA